MKAARSVAELQPKVNNVADVMVFLEVLGYTKQDALRNGFDDLNGPGARDLRVPRHPRGRPSRTQASSRESYIEVPTITRRIAEGLALSFGWLGSLVLLFIAGVSLWLSLLLPLKVTTVFMARPLHGHVHHRGTCQSFNRLFSFYHDQGNLAEAKRVLKRTYLEVGASSPSTVGGLYAVALLTHFPIGLFEIGMASLIVVSLHRVIYAIIYSLRKIAHLVVSYTLAFSALLFVYFGMGAIIPNAVDRYFFALVSAVVVLSSVAVYDQYRVLTGKSFEVKALSPTSSAASRSTRAR